MTAAHYVFALLSGARLICEGHAVTGSTTLCHIHLHKQSRRTEDILTQARMKNKGEDTDRKEVIDPNSENRYLQRSQGKVPTH